MKQLLSLINLFLLISFLSVLSACNGKTKSDETEKASEVAENKIATKLPQEVVLEQKKQDEQLEQESEAQPETSGTFTKPQDLELFDIGLYEVKPKWKTGFISLSEVYPLNEHPDSAALPDLSNKVFKDVQHLQLTTKFRKTFLAGTKISEADTLFLYDYAADVFVKFTVKSLGVIAIPNVYRTAEDWPFPQEDFMIGFEIKPAGLKKFGDYLGNTLVYIGKENPFVRGEVKPIKWQKIADKDFPATPTDAATYSKINTRLREFTFPKNFSILTNNKVEANTYKYETEGYQYFIKSFFKNLNSEGYKEVIARRLLVFKSESQELVCEKIYVLSDGLEPTPLNYTANNYDKGIYQWTGKLLKNKPPVIFGFEYASFGCSEITFLSKSEGDLYINCDNRH